MEPLRIYFRQHQLKDSANSNINVVVNCGATASYVPGNVPNPNWVEMTDFTEGLEALSLSWDAVNTATKGNSTTTNKAGSNYDKGISLELVFFGAAYDYIHDWLLSNKCRMLNSIDVRIYDAVCKKYYRLFEIKIDSLTYRPEDKCRVSVTLREQDMVWHNVHKTFIWDNHQNWFNQTGTSTKQHPTFLTCIEPRPRLMNSVRLAFVFFIHSNPAMNFIDFITNGSIKDDVRRILELNNFVPAPLIRTYIDNVAAKTGLAVDTIFHRPNTPEYYTCLFHPISGQYYENDSDSETSPSTAFIFENRWNVTLPELADKLRTVYGAEWYVTPGNTFVFKPVFELENTAAIYDFTAPGSKKLRDLTYSFSGEKKSAYGRYEYAPDGSDLGSQEIANLYNDVVDYDGPKNNPMLEGEKNKTLEFAPTAFVRDGRSPDYIRVIINDAETGAYVLVSVLAVVIAVLFAGTFTIGAAIALVGFMAAWVISIAGKADNIRDHFTQPAAGTNGYTGAVRLVSSKQTMSPRLIVWDGLNMNRAKAVATTNPPANTYYNPASTPYTTNNNIGHNNPTGYIFNYPAYFDNKYRNNLFDRFHDSQDNPLKSFETNQSFTAVTDRCCDLADIFGLWEDGDVSIGKLVKIAEEDNFDVFGRIEKIQEDHENNTLTLKGKVIKK